MQLVQWVKSNGNLASDQRVGGSSPSGRTTKNPQKVLKSAFFGGFSFLKSVFPFLRKNAHFTSFYT